MIRTCLAKDREQRFQSALDLARALEWSAEPSPATAARAGPGLAAALGAVCVALAAGLGYAVLRDTPPPPDDYVVTRLTYDEGLTTDPAISPDGTLVAFASDRSGENHLDIYVQQVTGGQAIRVTTADGDDHEPTFSPDGSTIAFRSERDGGGLYAVPTLGGDARVLARNGHDPRFSPDAQYIAYTTLKSGTDAFALSGQCYVIPAAGGEPRLMSPGFRGATSPMWIGNRTLLFQGVALADPTGMKWWVVDTDNPRPTVTTVMARSVHDAASNTASNNIVFVSNAAGDAGSVWTVPVDPRTAAAAGVTRRLTLGLGGDMRVALANDGSIAAAATNVAINVWTLPLTGDGVPRQITFDPSAKVLPEISIDGRYLTYMSRRTGNQDVYLRDMTTGRDVAIGASAEIENHPSFFAGGSRVAYAQMSGVPGSPFKLYVRPTGAGLSQQLTEGIVGRFDQVSDDSRYVVWHGGAEPVVGVRDLTTKIDADILRALPRSVFQPRISRDLRWIVFLVKANESDSRIYAAPFRGTEPIPPSEWIALTTGEAGDDKPRLTADHRRLFFTSEADGHRCIWVQPLDPDTLRPIGSPSPFHHFHSARRSLARVPINEQEISIGGDKLIFNMAETTGNVWRIQPR